MKRLFLLTLSLSFLALPAFAESTSEGISEMKLESEHETSFSDLNARLVPQVGMSSMGYTGKLSGDKGQGFSGGLTTELGATKARLLETGVLFMQTNSKLDNTVNGADNVHTSQLALPLMGKFRIIDTKSQSWYLKIGAMTTFQTASNQSTNAVDVLGSAGLGARLPIDRKVDFLLEATFNRGIMNVFLTDNSVEQGLLIFTGVSIAL